MDWALRFWFSKEHIVRQSTVIPYFAGYLLKPLVFIENDASYISQILMFLCIPINLNSRLREAVRYEQLCYTYRVVDSFRKEGRVIN